MAEPTEKTLSAHIVGQQVHLEYEAGGRTGQASGTLEEVDDRGVFVSDGDASYFYLWRNIVRIGLGHKTPGERRT